MKVIIENLNFNCIIGILDFERVTPQKVIINLSFKYKFKSDKSFIDYSIIVEELTNIMKQEKFKLLEDAIIHIDKYLKRNTKSRN